MSRLGKEGRGGHGQGGAAENSCPPQMKAIIFDIDGVLADSREAVVHNTACLMKEFGFRVPKRKIEEMSSAHSAETVLVSLAPSLSGDTRLLRRMLKRLSELTAENMGLIKPLPLAAALWRLSRRYRLAAATNRKRSAMMVLARLGIAKYFSTVMTSADAPPKPEPMMLLMAVKKLGVRKEGALFIGDNREDRLAADRAGVRFALIDGANARACERLLKKLLA